MLHKEINKIVENSKNAVLFIHGILGTPNFFNNFMPLIPETWSVCNMLLDGHGKGVEEFSSTSMEKWKTQVDKKIGELSVSHSNIIIVAHSMGTLFAIQQAVKNPEKIKAIFLLASPLRLFLKPQVVMITMKVLFEKVKPTDRVAVSAQHAYGIKTDKRLWKYLRWAPRYLELFAEIRNTGKIVSQLSVPCFAFQSKKDEMVSLASCKVLNTNPVIKTEVLKNSTHYYYDKSDFSLIESKFKELVNKL